VQRVDLDHPGVTDGVDIVDGRSKKHRRHGNQQGTDDG
jgi:hypothetical protein